MSGVEHDVIVLQVPDDIPLDADEARILQGLQRSDQMFQEVSLGGGKRKGTTEKFGRGVG